VLSAASETGRAEYVLPETASLYMQNICLVTNRIQSHFKSCGIQLHKPGTEKDGNRAVVEVGFHSLRHTFVSLCRESNAPLAVVESIVGHSNPSMTRHYTHVGELAAGRAVAALPSILGDDKQKKTAAVDDMMSEVRRIAKSLTGANWRTKKAAILELLKNAESVPVLTEWPPICKISGKLFVQKKIFQPYPAIATGFQTSRRSRSGGQIEQNHVVRKRQQKAHDAPKRKKICGKPHLKLLKPD
jgi:hypothetical protein